jgi:hypothetical protein
MNHHEGDQERASTVLRIGALAVALVALTAIVAPRLASSSGGGSAGTSTTSSTTSSTTTSTTAAPAAASLPPAGLSATTTAPPAGTTTAPGTTTTAAAPGLPSDDAQVRLYLVGTRAAAGGPERSNFVDGEVIGWHFRVSNTGEEYLWGVYVYLELYGRVACEDRRLEPGASTDCRAETTAWAGVNEAVAWVTAWTSRRMLFDELSYRYLVSPG